MVQQNYRVNRPAGPTVLPQDRQPRSLAAGTRVQDVFEQSERQLLILGGPGAGKTTLLLELAQDLWRMAQADNTQPIPVLVNLSSWRNPRQPILDWLVEELNRKYGLRSDSVAAWLKDGQLLPLLDGLDEVANEHQKTCAIAINRWMMGDLALRPCGLVVCCRREEYERVVRQPLNLYGAVYLQSLTRKPEPTISPSAPLSILSDSPRTPVPSTSPTVTRRELRPISLRLRRKFRSFVHAIPRRLRLFFIFLIGVIGLIWAIDIIFHAPVQISAGEEILITDKILRDNDASSLCPKYDVAMRAKRDGTDAMKNYDFRKAETNFNLALASCPNDPESLIYLNNAKASNDPLTIAVSVPINTNPNVAQEILRGVAHSQNAVNAGGGIKGKLLRVRIADDANNPEYAKKVATALVKEPKIIAVVGHNATDTSIAAASIYQQAGLVMISPTSGGEKLSNFGDSIFRTVPPVSTMASLLARYVVDEGNTKIATCADPDASDSMAFYDAFRTVLRDITDSKGNQGRLVEIQCSLTSNFNPDAVLSQAKENDVQGILLVPFIDHLERAIKLALQNNGLALYSSPTMNTGRVLKEGKAKMKGLTLPVIWERTQPESAGFAGTAKQLWGADVNWRTAMAYDATQAIIKGLDNSQNRAGLKATLSAKGFSANGANGPIQFLTSGDRQMDDPKTVPTLVRVEEEIKSSTGYEFKRISLKGTEPNNSQESTQPILP